MTILRRILCTLVLAASAVGVRAASPLEGDWQILADGASLRFVEAPGLPGSFDILWLDGPDLSIPPGTVIGSATASPSTGTYDCRVKSDPRGKGDKKNYVRFTITIDAETADSFTLHPYEQGTKIAWQALLPYWWRRPVRTTDTRPSRIDGALRIGAPKPYVEL